MMSKLCVNLGFRLHDALARDHRRSGEHHKIENHGAWDQDHQLYTYTMLYHAVPITFTHQWISPLDSCDLIRQRPGSPASCSRARASTSTCSASCVSFKAMAISARTAPGAHGGATHGDTTRPVAGKTKGNQDTEREWIYMII